MLSMLLSHASEIGLAIGVLLSFNAGRKLAMRLHDAELAKRYGRSLRGLGLVVYLYLFLGFVSTFVSIAATQFTSGLMKALIGLATGQLIAALYGIAISVASMVVGYYVFSRRYRGLEKPLTREGKIALRGIELSEGVAEKAKKGLDRLRGGRHSTEAA